MEFLGDSNNSAAVDVISFVREVVEKFPDLRSSIIKKLLQTFGDIKSGKVFRGALWIVGEYCTTEEGSLNFDACNLYPVIAQSDSIIFGC
jgi:coatomer subunit beta